MQNDLEEFYAMVSEREGGGERGIEGEGERGREGEMKHIYIERERERKRERLREKERGCERVRK